MVKKVLIHNTYIKRNCFTAFLTAIITVLIVILIMMHIGIAPFGDNSFASIDGRIQYLDFFSYYKDLLSGKTSVRYTFSAGLGMSTIGILAYYLMSPFNFFILFFSKSNMNCFFSLLVVLKMAMCGITISIYLNERFQHKISPLFVIVLSISYAMMQYNFSQNRNIMWLDGAYMLPLILLGVYYIANRQSSFFLSITVALSIIFQWYTAGINCLYSIAWFGMELALCKSDHQLNFKEIKSRVFMYLWSMFLGVMISLILFWPNIIAMRTGKGSFDWDKLTLNFNGNIFSAIQRYSIGSESDPTAVSLFCGGLAILGMIAFFTSKQFSKLYKRSIGILLVFSILIFYWQPLFFLYSLFKSADSYWFRYAYVSIFCIVFISGMYFSKWMSEKDINIVGVDAVIFSALLLTLNILAGNKLILRVFYTIIALLVEAVALMFLKNKHNTVNMKRFLSVVLCLVTVGELFENGKILAASYDEKYVNSYKEYSSAESKQIDSIKAKDNNLYRMNQTTTWSESPGNITANYNESLAYNYNGVASYTSSPQMNQLNMLEKMGYRTEANCISIVNTSIIPVDSLLGVKYILSEYPFNGYEIVNDLPSSVEDKSVYENPYTFPIAFTCDASGLKDSLVDDDNWSEKWNPFAYVNSVYSRIMNRQIEVFKPLSYTMEKDNNEIIYHLDNISKNETVYGNIPSRINANAVIDVNGIYNQNYSCWLSPSVFYIPADTKADIKLSADNLNSFEKPQFYACDLDVMREVSKDINNKSASITLSSEGDLKMSADVHGDNEALLTTIPYNSGWTVTVNGQKVKPQKFAGALMKISLNSGLNEIEIHYEIPGLKMGAIGSGVGLILLVLTQHLTKKSRLKRKENA